MPSDTALPSGRCPGSSAHASHLSAKAAKSTDLQSIAEPRDAWLHGR